MRDETWGILSTEAARACKLERSAEILCTEEAAAEQADGERSDKKDATGVYLLQQLLFLGNRFLIEPKRGLMDFDHRGGNAFIQNRGNLIVYAEVLSTKVELNLLPCCP